MSDTPTWSAPVRFAEVDQQGIVFNSHYLVYCDEAMGALLDGIGFAEVGLNGRLVASTLTWTAPARYGETIDVYARCARLGRTSMGFEFDVRVGSRACCLVTTTHVYANADGVPQPLPEGLRAVLG
jgi:acyl-CoA thioester hydrolase